LQAAIQSAAAAIASADALVVTAGESIGPDGPPRRAARPGSADPSFEPMFRRLLVPVDFTEKNERALAQARELAELPAGEITLVHVVETLEDELDADLEAFYGRLEAKAAVRMETSLERLGEGSFSKRSAIVLGHRARAIADFAEAERADVIVLSSHRVDPDRPAAGWMTISHKVAILARCPVLLVK